MAVVVKSVIFSYSATYERHKECITSGSVAVLLDDIDLHVFHFKVSNSMAFLLFSPNVAFCKVRCTVLGNISRTQCLN